MPLRARGMYLALACLWVGLAVMARAEPKDDATKPAPVVAPPDAATAAKPAAAGGQTPATDETGKAVLVTAKELLPCSRRRPHGVTGFWQPEPSLVAKIDADLQRVLRRDPKARQLLLPYSRYHRQYVGFLRGQQPMIYVNAFPVADAASLPGWQENLVVACDGGSRFWGIEYSVVKAKFSHFSVNRKDGAAKRAVVEDERREAR